MWAEEQEDPRKLDKWLPFTVAAPETPSGHCSGPTGSPPAIDRQADSGDQIEVFSSQDVHRVSAAGSCGRDVLVPWHVPLHRAEAAAAAAAARAAAVEEQPQTASPAEQERMPHCARHAVAVGSVNNSKGTGMFERYYHLFTEQELSALATQLSGVQSMQTFYDKSNWCLILESA